MIRRILKLFVFGKIGEFPKFRPLFGGKDTDSDDELPAQGFVKPPPSFSLDELKHMNQYVELKPAYDFLSSKGIKTRDFKLFPRKLHIRSYKQLSPCLMREACKYCLILAPNSI